jgi:hypothetical protein
MKKYLFCLLLLLVALQFSLNLHSQSKQDTVRESLQRRVYIENNRYRYFFDSNYSKELNLLVRNVFFSCDIINHNHFRCTPFHQNIKIVFDEATDKRSQNDDDRLVIGVAIREHKRNKKNNFLHVALIYCDPVASIKNYYLWYKIKSNNQIRLKKIRYRGEDL